MSDSGVLIKEINEKIDKLLSQNKQLRQENTSLRKERERLIEERTQHTKKIEELRHELKVTKFGNDLACSNGDKERAKRRLKTILREIDECIALINK